MDISAQEQLFFRGVCPSLMPRPKREREDASPESNTETKSTCQPVVCQGVAEGEGQGEEQGERKQGQMRPMGDIGAMEGIWEPAGLMEPEMGSRF